MEMSTLMLSLSDNHSIVLVLIHVVIGEQPMVAFHADMIHLSMQHQTAFARSSHPSSTLKKDTGGLDPISIPTSVEVDASTGVTSRRLTKLATMHLAVIRAYCSPMHRRGPIPKVALEKYPENLFSPASSNHLSGQKASAFEPQYSSLRFKIHGDQTILTTGCTGVPAKLASSAASRHNTVSKWWTRIVSSITALR